MIENGYTMGTISSHDGFSRNLDESDNSYSFSIYDKPEKDIYIAASMNYTGTNSIVFLRDYMLYELEKEYYYELKNGEVRNSYLDVQDGWCKAATDSLVSYSREMGCAEVLMNMIPLFVTDAMQEDALWNLADKEIYSVYCDENVIHYNDKTIEFKDLFVNDNASYTTFLIEE